jgi:hypothetical protein
MATTERPRGIRNITVTATLDRERYDALEDMSRGLGVTRSTAICRLLDLHAGVLLEEISSRPEVRFAPERSRSRRLSGELVVDVATLVREGMTKADAYRSVGVNEKTARGWEKQGREDRDNGRVSLHADLVSGLDQARAAFNHELIQEARRKGDYKVLLKLLDPEQFALPTRSEVDVTHRYQLLLDWDLLSLAESKMLAALMRKASPQEDHAAVTRTARPAIEAVPAEVVEMLDVEDGEWSEAPMLESGEPKAPALVDEKPEH